MAQDDWLWCHHTMTVTAHGRATSSAPSHTQPGGGAVGQSCPELWHVLGWRMRPPVQEVGGMGQTQHGSIALRAGAPMAAGKGHRKEVIFFQKTGAVST